MKHWLIYLLLTAGIVLTGSLPFTSHDVGELRPVQTVLVQMQEDWVILETDTGDSGIGKSWDAAMEDLMAKASGTVFIGTASFLLLEGNAVQLLPELAYKTDLNPGCGLCVMQIIPDLEMAGEYLNAHEPDWDLRRLRTALAAGEDVLLPELTSAEGRYLLVQSEN